MGGKRLLDPVRSRGAADSSLPSLAGQIYAAIQRALIKLRSSQVTLHVGGNASTTVVWLRPAHVAVGFGQADHQEQLW